MGKAARRRHDAAANHTKPHTALGALPPKRRAFVLAYCGLDDGGARWNGAEAAKRAGYAASNARHTAWELLRDDEVQAAVDEVIDGLRRQHEGLARRCIDELSDAAFARITDFVDVSDGVIRIRDDVCSEAWAAVAEISDTEHGLKVKMQPKAQLVSLLLKAIGHLQPDHRANVKVLQVGDTGASGDAGVLTRAKLERVRELLGIQGTIDVESEG